MHTRQQLATEARNRLEKQRVALMRIVGLPLNQSTALTSRLPYRPLPAASVDEAIARALENRADYKAADAQVRAAELTKRAEVLRRAPSVVFNGDIGALGTEPSNALNTWTATGQVRVPIFEGGRIQAGVAQAGAVLAQRKAERDDLRVSIEQEVTNAGLDVRTAGEQVEVASASIDLARRTLGQAQDRFAAGVTNNIEVIQAQEALANANRQYIGALQAHNLAKLMLARASGSAERTWKDILAQ
jgi:outer membrane protein TolC